MLVEGASSLAKKCGISDMVIGLTIVAFGTSAPELVVNVTSSLQGATALPDKGKVSKDKIDKEQKAAQLRP